MSSFKMVDDRVELARQLEALIEVNAETTARALAAFFVPLYESVSEEELYENELLRQRLLVRLVAKLRRQMTDAARAHGAENRKLDALRAQRDAKVTALYDELVEIRRQARAFYVDRAPAVVGIRGRTRRKPYPLARQARLALDCLAEPTDGSRESSARDLARRRSWSETLEPLHAAVKPAIQAVAYGKAATIATLKAKHEAMKDFDLHFGHVGRYVMRAYQLAGLDELAARVPPRVARKDRRKSSSRPIRLSEEIQRLPRQRLLDLANVVDLGRWVKQRLQRLGTASRRRRA